MKNFLGTLGLLIMLMPVIAMSGPVNINLADAPTIAKELSGIGLSRAQAIVAWRKQNGHFKTLQDLQQVKGIGSRIVEKNRANIRFEESDSNDDQ